ncbi:hypothetical protein IVB30_20150 [Bradyrhizobium sp. 200]|uniref:hypothetical protein n=1 Tax=Bradyrhizobium sp. 200 TaxID=2782665 RepID=UPI001FFE903B|nr:hypothetical protein [Bradyrhizobium sp. 200]UPJ53420.1 hypothetical protein IVB30_20150 [Bradyrhizobium sp. 200]
MEDFVALVVGISRYPRLPGWDIANDCTANDAIEVVTSLRNRGVPASKIKLLLSSTAPPAEVLGVRVHVASKSVLEDFFGMEVGIPPFTGKRFFFFWSGHGAEAQRTSEPLVITADSFKREDGPKRMFRCVPIDQIRTRLSGMSNFSEQIFCINACRTPIEWSLTPNDDTVLLDPGTSRRTGTVKQAAFFAVPGTKAAPVDKAAAQFSNGFARAIQQCIDKGQWPPDHGDWYYRLKAVWPTLWSPGAHSIGPEQFERLKNQIRKIDREDQLTLVTDKLTQLSKDVDRDKIGWRTTVLDLHSCTSDCLTLFMTHLEPAIIKNGMAGEGIQRMNGWPEQRLSLQNRRLQLIGELTLRLTGSRNSKSLEQIVEALAQMREVVRVVYVEIKGPYSEDDRSLVESMLKFWQEVIASAATSDRRPTLPLLIVGHVDPDANAPGVIQIDTETFYPEVGPLEALGRRLNMVKGAHLRRWLDMVTPAESNPWRDDLESEIVRELGGALIEEIPDIRMATIVNLVTTRAAGQTGTKGPS